MKNKKKVSQNEGENTWAKPIWILIGLIMFGCGIGLQNNYMFIGGMFLMFFALISHFPS